MQVGLGVAPITPFDLFQVGLRGFDSFRDLGVTGIEGLEVALGCGEFFLLALIEVIQVFRTVERFDFEGQAANLGAGLVNFASDCCLFLAQDLQILLQFQGGQRGRRHFVHIHQE